MKHYILAILVYPGMTALDAIGPYEILRMFPEIELRFVWKEIGPIITDSEILVIGATHTFEQTPTPDIIVVPGSSGDTAVMMADDDVIAWLKEAHPHTTYTTSVCSGSLILAAAGILDGLPATSHWLAMDALKLYNAHPHPNERVVTSGKVITAAGVSAGIDMALTLVGMCFGEQRAREAQLMIEYDPQPPFDAGHPSKVEPALLRSARSTMRRDSVNGRTVRALPSLLLKSMKAHLAGRRTVKE